MDKVAKKATKIVKVLGYIGVIIGFIGMILTFGLISFSTYKLIVGDIESGASPVIPGLPIAGTGLVFPLITGWIVIFIIIVIHEFSHGILASAFKIKVKNSGIAFFGPILGAFVEPDEKKLAKESHLVQHSVFAAGAFSNFLTVLVVLLIGIVVLNPLSGLLETPTGVITYSQPGFPAENAGIGNNTLITGINDHEVRTVKDFQDAMEDIGPGTSINVRSGDDFFSVTTIEDPGDESKGYIGVYLLGEKSELINDTFLNQILLKILNWFKQMFGWLSFLSLNIGLINLLPIFITDGARMLKLVVEKYIPDKKRAMSIWFFLNWISVASILIMLFLPLFRWIGSTLTNKLV